MQWGYCSNTAFNFCRRYRWYMVSIDSQQYCNGYLYIYTNRIDLCNNSSDHCNSNTTGDTDIYSFFLYNM